VVKGFRDNLFRGTSLPASRKEQIFQSMHPDLQGRPIAFQRADVRSIILLPLMCV